MTQFHEGPSFTFTHPLKEMLAFFSWHCKLVLLSKILFPISYFPFSWFKSIRLSGVGLCVHEFPYLVPRYCWLEAHESISIFTTLPFRLHQTAPMGKFKKEVGTLHSSQPTGAALLSTGWCTKTSHTAHPPHFLLTAIYCYLFIMGRGEGGNIHPDRLPITRKYHYSGKLNTSSMMAIKQHTSYWFSNSKPSVTFIIALRSTPLVTVLLDVGNNYCHQFMDGSSFH